MATHRQDWRERLKIIKAHQAQGMSISAISRKLGWQRTWIQKVLAIERKGGNIDGITIRGTPVRKLSGVRAEIRDRSGSEIKPSDLASRIASMLDLGDTKQRIAETLGIDRSTIYLRLVPHYLIEEIQDAIDAGSFTINQARPLARLPHVQQRAIWKRGILALSRREIERIVQGHNKAS